MSAPAALLNQPRIAIIYILLAHLQLTSMDAMIKWLTDSYSVPQIAFIRYLICLPIAIALATRSTRGLHSLKTRALPAHLWRSAFNILTMIAFYLSLSEISLASTVSISLAAPIFMTIFAIPILGEKVSARRWIAVLAGFGGILLIAQPGPDGISYGAMLALIAAVTWALTLVSSRSLSRTEESSTILFYYALSVVICLGVTMPWFWTTPDNLVDIGLFLAIGLTGSFGQYCLAQAFRHAQVSVLAPFEYSALLWAILIDILIWSSMPTMPMLAGSGIVIAACLYILHAGRREKARGG